MLEESTKKISIKDIANGKYSLDMTGIKNWSNRVKRLREILNAVAPKTGREPEFSFASFYYCKDGYWYASDWKNRGSAVDVFDVEYEHSV